MKRDLSIVVPILIVILLALASIAIILVVIKDIISEDEGVVEIPSEESALDLDIQSVKVEGDGVSVNVKRNLGEGDITKVRFVFQNETHSEIIEKETNIEELERRNFIFILGEMSVLNPTNVSIAPVYKSAFGKKTIGVVADRFEIRVGSVFVEEDEGVIIQCSCDVWTDNFCEVGNCSFTQMQQTRGCTPASCLNETRCVESSACVQPINCTCTDWMNDVCGESCSSTQMQQNRSCSPEGCLVETRCVSDSSCLPQTPDMGPLTVHPTNPRYFADGNGNVVYLTGSHTWTNFQD